MAAAPVVRALERAGFTHAEAVAMLTLALREPSIRSHPTVVHWRRLLAASRRVRGVDFTGDPFLNDERLNAVVDRYYREERR